MENAILMGPFIGEMYWESARFAPLLPYLIHKKYKGKGYKYIVYTREDRFDLYGNYADILVPLRIPDDYETKFPNCFKLNGLKNYTYQNMAKQFKNSYKKRFKIIDHIYPSILKPDFLNKNQFSRRVMEFTYSPRKENYKLVDEYLPNSRPVVVLAPRFREGFKRNWKHWPEFYDLLWKDETLRNKFHFIICGKKGEYIPDPKRRFFDMNDIELNKSSSLIGLLLVILEKAFFTFGSQSAIPNLSLLYKVDVLEFGCQKNLHTRTYNIFNTPITFIENKKYNIEPNIIYKKFKSLLLQKERRNGKPKKHMVSEQQSKNRKVKKRINRV